MVTIKKIIFTVIVLLILALPIRSFASQGCCSWHGGVSYCGSNGYYICNDGTQSPSCACYYSGNIGGMELTDTSSNCDYSSYKDEIETLKSQITDLEKKIMI